MVIPRYVHEIILRTERDELVGREQWASQEIGFEAALPTEEALLHPGVRLARDANNRADQEVSHTSNEKDMSEGRAARRSE
jgi:hypothetical protein